MNKVIRDGSERGCKRLPFSGKLFCSECKRAFVRRESMRTYDIGSMYWRCKEFRAGRYIPLTADTCRNGIRISDYAPSRAFINAWNSLEKIKVIVNADMLKQYRIHQLNQLLDEYGNITQMPYELMLKTLDHIEIDTSGMMIVKFLAGERITITI